MSDMEAIDKKINEVANDHLDGLEDSLKEDDNLYNGLNLKNNEIVHKSVKESFNL